MFRLPEEISNFDADEHRAGGFGADRDKEIVLRGFEVAASMAAAYNREFDSSPIGILETPVVMAALVRGFRAVLTNDGWDLLVQRIQEEVAKRPHQPFR